MASDTTAIRIEGLRLAARGKRLLEGFSLVLEAGERCTLTGPSGSGKTTLLRCLLGFSVPESGTIDLLGRRLRPESVWELRRQIAWVPQEPELGEGTPRDALEGPFRYKANRHLKRNVERIPELLARFRLDAGLLAQPISKLSGGEKQRVAIMAAVLLERPILLLDEATSALDAAARDSLLEYLGELDGTTILSVSHDPEKFPVGHRRVDLTATEARDGTV